MTERRANRIRRLAEVNSGKLTNQETSISQPPSGQTFRMVDDRRYRATDLGVRDLRGVFEAGDIQSRPGHNKRARHKGR